MVMMNVPIDSEIGRLLREAEAIGEPLRIDTGEATYTVLHDEDAHTSRQASDDVDAASTYDPERLRANLGAWAGLLSKEEAEALKQYIYEAREAGTRGLDRP